MIPGPLKLLFLAVALMLASVVLAFLMVLRLLEATLFLCFLSFILTVGGIILGFVGMAMYLGPRQRDGRRGAPPDNPGPS